MSSTRYYEPEVLARFSNQVFAKFGVPEKDASIVTNCLLYADLHGHPSHGIVRLPVYAQRIKPKSVNPNPTPRVVQRSAGSAVVDGDNALGPVAGNYSMKIALEIASESGVGFVATRRSNHFGPAAFYAELALKEGFIGVAASNAPPNMAPWGGRDRFLGTNPFAVAVPAGKYPPIILDMATSTVARGNIILAAQKGEPIPLGWALDPEGNPTTDAKLGLLGPVLPFGGPKGSAISLLIDIFSGVLSGSSYGRHLNTLEDLSSVQNLGHFFLAIRIDSFIPYEDFCQKIEDLIGQLKKTPLVPGVQEILYPGEIELRKTREIEQSGIPVTEDVYDQLCGLGETVSIVLGEPRKILED